MVNKSEERKQLTEENMENKDISKILAESNTEFSKIFEVCDEWIKAFQKSFDKNYPIPTIKSNKEMLEKFLSSAEESNKLYKSWISELEENSRKTKEMLQGEQDPAKYKEYCDMWIKSYEKMFNELLEVPAQKSTKEAFGYYMGIPDIYSENFLQMSRLWKKSYEQFCRPLIDSMLKLSYISQENAGPDTYKEFYKLLAETYGKHIQCVEPQKEIFEHFIQNTNVYVSMYKSWIAAIECLSESVKELSEQKYDPEKYKEFYNLWIRIYEKAFDSFFEDIPTIEGPMKEIMEPLKIMAKMYADIFAKMSRTLVEQSIHPTPAYPTKKN
jgi:hypothetical protein